jgi:hypothetical protein
MMKKKSIKDLDSIKKDGWIISEEDLEKIADRKSGIDFKKSVSVLSESISKFTDASMKSQKENNDKIELIIKAQATFIKTVFENLGKLNTTGKNWEFDVKRNKSGFISKIYAKQL